MWSLILAANLIVQVPLLGNPLTPAILQDLGKLPGVARVEAGQESLRIDVRPGEAVRLSEISSTIRNHTVRTEIDTDRIALGKHTIFQMDAGQCFFCAESPLRQRLSRKAWVEDWAVIDYAARGRMRFRIETNEKTFLETLGQLPYEDILFTTRYDGINDVNLDWPHGGVAWRENEETARAEASRSQKPLLIFPTAGT